MSEFAFPFPVSVFLDLVDLPQERMENFLEWEFMLLHAPDPATLAKGARLVVDYLRGIIEERRLHPQDDFISFAVQAKMQGRKLTEDELIGFCFNLFIGGLDTVSTNMGLHFRHLAENQEHQKRLREDPAFIPTAMEELLRAFAAVTTFRTCIKETRVSGVTIKPGDKIAMCTAVACRDPEFYERPNEILLDRAPAHLTFASGPHRCIGSHLARRELLIALQEFLAAIPEFRIEPGAKIKTHLGGMVQPKALPLVWKT
jgi:cytochrome P450